MQVVTHNLSSIFTQNQLKAITGRKEKNTEKLSSGYRINRSADDAAGLAISEKMRWQIRGLNKASQNIQDGISFVQTGEGALNEVHDMLQRVRELAVQASNDTNTTLDRENLNREVQQIKKEMNRVFSSTEFNTIHIFRTPIIPNVSTQPNDYELYNSDDGITPAGIMINNKRYTWGELGLDPGKLPENDWEKKFTDDNGELVYLTLKKGKPLSEVQREYILEADSAGIKINNLYSGYWDSTIAQSGNTYSWSWHGMELSFDSEGDDRESIIGRLNGDGLFVNGWSAIPIGSEEGKAVVSSGGSLSFNVTENNKNSITDWKYEIQADETGVKLKQTEGNDGLIHTLTMWKDFRNQNSGEEYPISDWGRTDQEGNPITLDRSAVYRYRDNASASYLTNAIDFTFSFPENEVSMSQAAFGLSEELIAGKVNAPIKAVLADDGVSVTGYANLDSFEFERDVLLRNFGDAGSSASMAVQVERTLIKDASVTNHVWDGSTWVPERTYDLDHYTYSGKNSQGAEVFSASEGSLFLNTGGNETSITIYDFSGRSTIYNTQNASSVLSTTLRNSESGALIHLKYDAAAAESRSNTLTVSPDGPATRTFFKSSGARGNVGDTLLKIKAYPPNDKSLHIQAGALKGQSVDLKWTGLSNMVLGIGTMKTTTRANSQAAIKMADDAIQHITNVRVLFGTTQNRLEFAYNIDRNTEENTQYAESRIRDTDMAREMVDYSRNDILSRAGQAMLTQANQLPNGILTLLT